MCDSGENQLAPKPHGAVQIETQVFYADGAPCIAAQTRQLHVVDAVDQAKTVEHRRPGQYQHGYFGNSGLQMLAYGDHPTNIAQAKGVVRIDQYFYRPDDL